MPGKSISAAVRVALLIGALLALNALSPASAAAHGALNPVASSYRAQLRSVPAGLAAQVVDGDLRLWLQVRRGERVVLLDSRGDPYLRFARGRIWANENSELYYFNQIPPVSPPTSLTAGAPVRWLQVGTGESYEWHEGRLHALALAAVAPGASDVGTWRIPVTVNGRRATIVGTLWYRPAPSLAWFWPIVVVILCVLAAWRLRDPSLDATLGRALALVTLLGIVLAAVGRDLHGRPGLSGFGVFELAVIVALSAWTTLRIARDQAHSVALFVIVIAALWEGLSLLPTLLDGYVLLAVPAFLGRLATVLCLGGGIALILPAVRLFQRDDAAEADDPAHDPGVAPASELPVS